MTPGFHPKTNIVNQIYHSESMKPNLPNQIQETKPNKPNLRNKTHQTKPTLEVAWHEGKCWQHCRLTIWNNLLSWQTVPEDKFQKHDWYWSEVPCLGKCATWRKTQNNLIMLRQATSWSVDPLAMLFNNDSEGSHPTQKFVKKWFGIVQV